MSIFKYLDYKTFLAAQIARNRQARGYLSQLAKAAGCQLSVLSHVSRGKVHLTAEQAAGMAEFWSLGELETDYFLELVSLGRAGTPRLRTQTHRRLQALKARSENLSARLGSQDPPSGETQAIYYSSWHWVATHILTSIPAYSTSQAISERVGLPLHLVQNTLESLAAQGLVRSERNRWRLVTADLHLPRSSPLNAMNHLNWRQRAIADIQSARGDSIHYTAVQSLSLGDLEGLREATLQFIRDSREFGKAGGEEEMVGITMDVFRA